MEARGESLPYHCHLYGIYKLQNKWHEHVVKRALTESQLWAWGEPMLDLLDLAGRSGVFFTEVLGMHDDELHSKLREALAATAFRETKFKAICLEAALKAANSKETLLQTRIAELDSELQQVQQLPQPHRQQARTIIASVRADGIGRHDFRKTAHQKSKYITNVTRWRDLTEHRIANLRGARPACEWGTWLFTTPACQQVGDGYINLMLLL
ncbi:hypothetical protein JKP88DRAFT_245263 [Tribonema minus]|uniref:Uncharacterized protein n=1 Tax=Tribonema minus TaxID=303371 RepID=A0A836CGY8_9STRA|nr:hypothetical protein JKP88DRAFT_245263 [Tribonema minus]